MWLMARWSPRVFRAMAYPLLAVSVIGLGLTLIHGVAVRRNEVARWIAIGPITFQPSELAKLALAVWGADLLARKEKLGMLADWRHMLAAAGAGGRPARHAGDGGRRPRHHQHPADHPARAAVVRRDADAGVHPLLILIGLVLVLLVVAKATGRPG